MRRSTKWLSGVVVAIVGAAAALAPWPVGSDLRRASVGSAFAGSSDVVRRLIAADGAASDEFGWAVAISGNTAVVGAINDDDNGAQSGSAYVFVRSGEDWTLQQKLRGAADTADDLFGYSVAVSGDTALVGAPKGSFEDASSGLVYVFVRSGGVWTQAQELGPEYPGFADFFGCSVSLSGNTALVGAWGTNDIEFDQGAAYAFVRSGGTWQLQQTLTASDPAYRDKFGTAVSLDADTALIGAPEVDDKGDKSGAAYLFVRSAGVWTQQRKVMASDGAAGSLFGLAVSVSGDTAVVGAPHDDQTGADSGAAYAFDRSGGTWPQQWKFAASDGAAGDFFGGAVVLAGDVALIGAPTANDSGADSGSARVFVRSGGVWALQQKLTPTDGAAGDYHGYSVALSGDTALVGAAGDDDNGFDSGTARTWRLDIPVLLPIVDVQPQTLAFERTLVGQTSAAAVVTVRNSGTRALNVSGTSVAGVNATEFSVVPGGPAPAPSLTPTVAPGASVTFAVTFAPASGGSKSAILRVTSDDPVHATIDVPLHGDAVVCVASPTTGTIGTVVAVQGVGFGAKKGKLLVLGGKKPLALKVTRWNVGNDGVVTGVITGPLPPGAYHVCVAPPRAAQIVDPSVFTFAAPAIVSVSPAGGPKGTEVVLTCTALGTAKGSVSLQASGAKKRIKCTVTAWPRDTTSGTGQGEAKFRVPKKLTVGMAYDVVVVTKVGEVRAVGAFTAAP